MDKAKARRRRYIDAHPDRVKASDAKYRLRNKDKIAARSAVNYQLRAGYWSRPDQCDSCRNVGRVEAHHDDYKKRLEVKWLCKLCHEKQ